MDLKEWLCDDVGLPMYLDKFILHEFRDMDRVMLLDAPTLMNLFEIKNPFHVRLILKKFKEKEILLQFTHFHFKLSVTGDIQINASEYVETGAKTWNQLIFDLNEFYWRIKVPILRTQIKLIHLN